MVAVLLAALVGICLLWRRAQRRRGGVSPAAANSRWSKSATLSYVDECSFSFGSAISAPGTRTGGIDLAQPPDLGMQYLHCLTEHPPLAQGRE